MYNPKLIESKWRKYWEDNHHNVCINDDQKPKYYCLDMFPYPSGSGLHVGHWRGYIISDVISRYKKLCGFNVLHPIGWDAFGLPAENDAIKKKIHPKTNVQQNINNIRRQLKEMGNLYDWSREFSTTDVDYYKWTQWLFLKFYKKGLAYRSAVSINWCPSCKCGLANEEVLGGCCERCGEVTEKQSRLQWLMKITDYSERLLKDLDDLKWPEKIKMMQRNWIGLCEGLEVVLDVAIGDCKVPLKVFIDRSETFFGITAIFLAPEHSLVEELLRLDAGNRSIDINNYVKNAKNTKELTRMQSGKRSSCVPTNYFAVHPITGNKISIWISENILMNNFGGVVPLIPAHNRDDFDFAKRSHVPIIEVIKGEGSKYDKDGVLLEPYLGDGKLINSGIFTGKDSRTVGDEITQWLLKKNKAETAISYRLRDWVFSRQRYWGEPIPIVYCQRCGEVPVPEDQLPVKLPYVDHYEPSGTGDSPLSRIDSWINTKCPCCNGHAVRETDTMPQWAGSCWYFLRFVSPHEKNAPFERKAVDKWLPVDLYIGGAEHAVLHLLYARFFTKVLCDEKLISFDEPFTQLFSQGAICRKIYRCNCCRKWIEVERIEREKHCPDCDGKLEIALGKMSKSKANAVSPDLLVDAYGTDAVRLYVLFIGPPEKQVEWNDKGIKGCYSFLNRYYIWAQRCVNTNEAVDSVEVLRKKNNLIKEITDCIKTFKINNVVASFMKFINDMLKLESNSISCKTLEDVSICLSPFAPHLAEEIWIDLLNKKSTIFKASWPTIDEAMLSGHEDTIDIVLQINGKFKNMLVVPVDLSSDSLNEYISKNSVVKNYTQGKKVKRMIVVPGKLVNLIV